MLSELIVWGVVGVLILTVIAAAGLMCAPLQIYAELDTEAQRRATFRATSFWGLLSVTPRPHAHQKRPKKATQRVDRDRSEKSKGAWARIPISSVLRAGPELLSGLASRITVEAMNINLRYGLPDPADTGMVYGMLAPAISLARPGRFAQVDLQPDFTAAVLAGRGQIVVRLIPATLLPPLFQFGWAVFVAPRFSVRAQ